MTESKLPILKYPEETKAKRGERIIDSYSLSVTDEDRGDDITVTT